MKVETNTQEKNKTCTICKETKPSSLFVKNRNKCTSCMKLVRKEYRNKNIESIKTTQKKYYEKNKENLFRYRKEWALKNKEKQAGYNREWGKRAKGLKAQNLAKYRASLKDASPAWADVQYMKDLYTNCREAEQVFSIINRKFHVDHIVPISGVNVCGLHCEYNLQILEASENIRKSNYFKD